jgi:protein arginine kinase activator
MICPFCHKNEATIHYAEVKNGEVNKIDICQECAKEKGIDVSLPFSFSDILTALTGTISSDDENSELEYDFTGKPACDMCGLKLRDLVHLGRLGCPHCYDVFHSEINKILENVQKAPSHSGKIPAQLIAHVTGTRRIDALEKELKEAVENEKYELCVTLRDEIKQLKNALISASHANGDTHA